MNEDAISFCQGFGTLFRYFLGVCFVECSISKIDQFVVSSLAKNARLGLNGMQCGWLILKTNQETISQKSIVTCLLHSSQNELEYSLLRIAQFLQAIIVSCVIVWLGNTEAKIAGAVPEDVDLPDKQEYRAANPNSDKHKFGYELGENKHFHHTTTDEDGVRLGCYGHVLDGKKYSTQYVADNKGYRIVPTHDLITVFPKSGGERKASFIREFSEVELLSNNIRFFFPDGCQAKEHVEAAESRKVSVRVPPPVTTTTTTPRPTTAAPKCYCTCE